MKDATLGLLVILFAILAMVLWPMGVIWSVNTLFDLHIPMNFRTWLATVILVTMLRFNWESPKKR